MKLTKCYIKIIFHNCQYAVLPRYLEIRNIFQQHHVSYSLPCRRAPGRLLDVSRKLTIILPSEDFWGYIIRGSTKSTGGVSSPQAFLWEQAEKSHINHPLPLSPVGRTRELSPFYHGRELTQAQTYRALSQHRTYHSHVLVKFLEQYNQASHKMLRWCRLVAIHPLFIMKYTTYTLYRLSTLCTFLCIPFLKNANFSPK